MSGTGLAYAATPPYATPKLSWPLSVVSSRMHAPSELAYAPTRLLRDVRYGPSVCCSTSPLCLCHAEAERGHASIFATLYQGSMDSSKAAILGTHCTMLQFVSVFDFPSIVPGINGSSKVSILSSPLDSSLQRS
eukprot:3941662-Rhodomonas_salina.1